jgi:hypothetical protein
VADTWKELSALLATTQGPDTYRRGGSNRPLWEPEAAEQRHGESTESQWQVNGEVRGKGTQMQTNPWQGHCASGRS